MITLYNMDVIKALKLLPSESVDMQITSPPYWNLRDYGSEVETIWDADENCEHDWNNKKRTIHSGTTKSKISGDNSGHLNEFSVKDNFCSKCGAWKGQLGLEQDFNLYIKHMLQIFDEVKRVLKKDGTCWVNLGDSYGGSGNSSGHTDETTNVGKKTSDYGASKGNQKFTKDYAKCLMGIPERFMLGMIDHGWILRNKIIWHKPNHMPSSVRDRLSNSWEYLFFFSKSKKYYFDLDAVREPHKEHSIERACRGRGEDNKSMKSRQYAIAYAEKYKGYDDIQGKLERGELRGTHPLGKNPGDIIQTKQDFIHKRKGSYDDPLHVKAYSELGKNPDDVISIIPETKDKCELCGKNCYWFGARAWEGVIPEEYTKKILCLDCYEKFSKNADPIKKQQAIQRYLELEQKEKDKLRNPLGKNPDDVIKTKFQIGDGYRQGMNRDERLMIEIRPLLPKQKEFVDYLKTKIKNYEKELDKEFGETKWRHWIRYDETGFSYPSKEDWARLYSIIPNLDKYAKEMTYTELKLNTIITNELGKNPSDYWDITTHGYPEAHFAVFPEKLVERPIKTTPTQICNKCGKARERIVETELIVTKEYEDKGKVKEVKESGDNRNVLPRSRTSLEGYNKYKTKGWTSCSCNAGFHPAVILDIFTGSGTTLKVARDLYRDAIGIEIKKEYCDLIEKRLFYGNRTLTDNFKIIR